MNKTLLGLFFKLRENLIRARMLAKVFDYLIFLLASSVFYPLGFFLGFFYLTCGDGLFQGQSLGKKLFSLQVVQQKNQRPCSLKKSWIRNIAFFLSGIFTIIPYWGWVITLLLLTPLALYESYILIYLKTHKRLGDEIAETEVISLLSKKES